MLIVAVEVLVLLGLVAANALLAASEIAVVSSRPARLKARAEAGEPGAEAALELIESPNDFLSTVQVGITGVAILSGAWGGAAIGESLGRGLGHWMDPRSALLVGIAVSVTVIAYLTVVIGELVPKRLALSAPERLACLVAPTMRALARFGRPAVVLLSASMDLVLRLLPRRRAPEPEITEEEVRILLSEATAAGVLEDREHAIVERLFLLSDRTAGSLMTPRDSIVWLDLDNDVEEELRRAVTLAHARFVVSGGELDRVRGYVSLSDLLAQVLSTGTPTIEAVLRRPHFVRPWDTAFEVLEMFQHSSDHIALVLGRKGRVEGIVTLTDMLEGLLGDLPEQSAAARPGAVRREDGSWLVDGLIPFEEFLHLVGRGPATSERHATLHAFVVESLGDEPKASDVFHWEGLRLEVVDMDWNRVDKVLVQETDPTHA